MISDKEIRDMNADYTERRERSGTVSAHLYKIPHKAATKLHVTRRDWKQMVIVCTRQLHSSDIAQSGHSLLGYYSNVIPNTKGTVPYASVSLTLLCTVLTSCITEINIQPKQPRTYNVT